MKLDELTSTPAWEWPEGTDDFLLAILRDRNAPGDERLVAAELAGDYAVVNDDIARALLAVAAERGADEELRCTAAISLGPALEDADMADILEPALPSESVISLDVFQDIRRGLRKIYMDADSPDRVRRSVLEAAVRAPEEWHREAVRGAYARGSDEWRLTAVFCMRFVDGFEDEVAATLDSEDPVLLREAILAAGNKELTAAWPLVQQLLEDDGADRELRIAAIEASPGLAPELLPTVLAELAMSADEEIAAAANEAMALASGLDMLDELDDLDDEDDDERG